MKRIDLIGRAEETKPRNLAIVAFEGAEMLDITGPHEVFAIADNMQKQQQQTEKGYSLFVLAEKAGPFTASSGLQLVADASWRNFTEEIDT
jgi:transcriptional regulator GlxA family with amidase domain